MIIKKLKVIESNQVAVTNILEITSATAGYASLNPKKLFLKCPKWIGLFVFGDEYSTKYNGDFSVISTTP